MEMNTLALVILVFLATAKQCSGWTLKNGEEFPPSQRDIWSRTTLAIERENPYAFSTYSTNRLISSAKSPPLHVHSDRAETENFYPSLMQPITEKDLLLALNSMELSEMIPNWSKLQLQSKNDILQNVHFDLPSNNGVPNYQMQKIHAEPKRELGSYPQLKDINQKEYEIVEDELSHRTKYANDINDSSKYSTSHDTFRSKNGFLNSLNKLFIKESNNTLSLKEFKDSVNQVQEYEDPKMVLSQSKESTEEESNLHSYEYVEMKNKFSFNKTPPFLPWYRPELNGQSNGLKTSSNSVQKLHRGIRAVGQPGMTNNCHSNHLHKCGAMVIQEFNLAPTSSRKCEIREEFLNCMVNERERGCSLSKNSAHSPEETNLIRSEVKSLFWSANRCLF